VIAHSCDHSCLCVSLQLLTNDQSEVEVITLGLLPNIMRSIVSCPIYQVKVHRFDFFEEQVQSLRWKIAIIETSPKSSWLFD